LPSRVLQNNNFFVRTSVDLLLLGPVTSKAFRIAQKLSQSVHVNRE